MRWSSTGPLLRSIEFHRRRATGDAAAAAADAVALLRDELAPAAWWAPVLCDAAPLLAHERMLFSPADACVLLQRLEEVHARTAHGAGEDYLGILARVVGGGAGGEKRQITPRWGRRGLRGCGWIK